MRADSQNLRRRLVQVAALQSGYFTAAEALEAGYSYQAQKYHADRGNWSRVGRGLYRLSEWPYGEYEELVRWSLWSRDRGVISHETALAVYDLSDVNPPHIHLTVPPDFYARARGVVLHRDLLPPEDISPREGFRVTTPTRTLLDVAREDLALDLLRAAVKEACEQEMVTPQQLLDRADHLGDRAALRIERSLRLETSGS